MADELEKACEWCYQHGYHDCGDFHVQFGNGGVVKPKGVSQ